MSFVTRTLATAAAGAVVLGLAGPAVAQQAAQTQSSQAQPPAAAAQGAPAAAAANVSDTQLRTFISAATEVQAISQKWQEKAAGSNSAEEVEEVRRQATDEMVGAVEEKGMTVDEFNAISQAAQQDPELKARIVAMIQQQQ